MIPDLKSRDEIVSSWRTACGYGAMFWSGDGHAIVEPTWWVALSGAKTVEYNMALCHGPDPEDLRRALAEIRAEKVPAVIMLGGHALGNANLLANEGWVCIGSTPLEVMTDLVGDVDPNARRIRPEELPAAHAMLTECFGIAPAMTSVAFPAAYLESPTREVFGMFDGDEMVSCMGCVTIDRMIVMWSLATPAAHRRRGHGGRLLSHVLATKRNEGVETALFWASAAGESLYKKLGFTVVEYLQRWSRARWAFPPV